MPKRLKGAIDLLSRPVLYVTLKKNTFIVQFPGPHFTSRISLVIFRDRKLSLYLRIWLKVKLCKVGTLEMDKQQIFCLANQIKMMT